MSNDDFTKGLRRRALAEDKKWRRGLSEADKSGLVYLDYKVDQGEQLNRRYFKDSSHSHPDICNVLDESAAREMIDADVDHRAAYIDQIGRWIDANADSVAARAFRGAVLEPMAGLPAVSYETLSAELSESPTRLQRHVEHLKRKLRRAKLAERAKLAGLADCVRPPEARAIATPLRDLIGGDGYLGLIRNWEFDAKCMAALDWRPCDSIEAEHSGTEIAGAFNSIMERMGLDIRLQIDRVSYQLIELRPMEGVVATAVLVPKLSRGNDLERWAAFVFVSYSLALLVKPIVGAEAEERFRRESRWEWERELKHTGRGRAWARAANDRDSEIKRQAWTESAKEPELKRQKTNWPLRAGFFKK